MAVADPTRDLKKLAAVEHQMAALAEERVRLVAAAQSQGATWDAIGAALGVTRQSAWETYSKLARQAIDAATSTGTRSEDELLESAAASLRRYRARR